MMNINIRDIDLNLLIAFDALIQEGNVTRAGFRIGLSQSSMSHALTRLRKLMDDPLFVRTHTGMEPTAFALQISAAVSRSLALFQSGLDGAHTFDPLVSTRTFQLLLSDIGEIAYLPRLLARLKTDAPGINLRALVQPRERYRAMFESQDADLAIGFLPGLQDGFYQQRLLSDSYVCIARRGHPRVKNALSLDQFSREFHVMVEPGGSRYERATTHSSTTTFIEHHLSERGLRRRVAMRVPHFVVVPIIVRSTDLLAIVPSYLMSSMKVSDGLKILPLPFDAPSFDVKQFWHKRNHHDAANKWLRRTVAELFAENRPRRGR